ncbi:MAG: sarcosine oxidase subunit alpha [Rhizobiales bacterium NRL2]|jgi:sarcosine oxidase subunit alpha|nr:MAG: sarcosine oxidase subunit alpha [Rhizobiales bacterium NRL2]
MSQSHRIEGRGLIDRARHVSFRFAGRDYLGHQGDTMASALLANGEIMVARSFKYHRPRGIVAAGVEDPAAMVQLGGGAATDPNVLVTDQEIHDGLVAEAQNAWPSLKYDIGAANDALSRFFPAGFYYKTFMGGPGWMRFEPFIRRAAGLGRAPEGPDPDRYEAVNRHCDVLIAGAGPAGLMAALSAARSGARVILAEGTPHAGGSLLSAAPESVALDGQPVSQWLSAVLEELRSHPEVTILTRTTAFGYYAQNFVGLLEKVQDHLPRRERDGRLPRQRVWRVRAKQVVLATGALERPLVFHENDRPGIMLAGAARTFLNRYGVIAGKRVLIFANNDTAWQTAFDLHDAGAEIAGIVDLRRDLDERLALGALKKGIAVHPSTAVVGTTGRHRVNAACLAGLDGQQRIRGSVSRIDCDLIAVSGGWNPNVALFAQSRGQLRWDETLTSFRPGRSWQAERSAGACNGVFDLAEAMAEGARAGVDAARASGFTVRPKKQPEVETTNVQSLNVRAFWEVPGLKSGVKAKAFVDLQDDVKTSDLKLAIAEGYDSVEHAKRYTTQGMGTDQGKISNVNAFGIMAEARGISIPEVGTTTFRQPYRPVTIGALAGQHVGPHFVPRRTTAMHDWHVKRKAVFEPVGDWLRARAYPKTGESFHDAVQREALAARTTAGMLDASTLGKIDIKGPDARTFLNRVYTNAWKKLPVGACRYGLMLGEDGMIVDDGVTACLADDHFHMTTTTGGAAGVLRTLEDYLQTEWPDLKVWLTTTTEQWAVCAVCGPNAKKIVEQVVDGVNLDPETFPFMTWREGSAGSVPVRVFRISFSGELSYEINIPATYGLWLWERLIEAGEPHGLVPYGTETMHLLRAEKGFIIVGQETDGTNTPQDLAMPWAIAWKKGDFIGKRSLSRPDTARDDRRQLVGLFTDDPAFVAMEGSQIIETPEEPKARPIPMIGHVTSSYMSPNLKRSIALAVVRAGSRRMGETVYISRDGDRPMPARIVGHDFLAAKESSQ